MGFLICIAATIVFYIYAFYLEVSKAMKLKVNRDNEGIKVSFVIPV